MYILTYIQPSIPPDTNVHINIQPSIPPDTNVHINIHTTYQRAFYRKYQSIYLASIPPDTNVHINIHGTVHITRYQCTY